MGEIVLRRARAGEIDDLNALILRSKAHWGYDDTFMNACREELRLPPGAPADPLFRVAAQGETPLGCIKLTIAGGMAEVDLLYVDPDAIGSGIGRTLMGFAELEAQTAACEALEVTADPNAAPFYQRLGYVEVGSAPSESIPGRNLPRLRRPIESGARDV